MGGRSIKKGPQPSSTPAPVDELWVTADGDVIAVSDMDPEHAKNTLRFLIRRLRAGKLVQLAYHTKRLRVAAKQGLEDVEHWSDDLEHGDIGGDV